MTILPWQHADWQHLSRYLIQQRIPQALLISGNKGIGKQVLALNFAHALLCEQPKQDFSACETCHSCLLLKAGTHPDFMLVQPEEGKTSIAIDQIRNLIVKLSLKPQFERYRVVILSPADKMNTASSNAFLKCLEEPNERTVILLVTDKPSKLPATIRSRCQKLIMPLPEHDVALSWLKQQIPNDAEILLSLAQGAPLFALDYAQQELLSLRNQCFGQWLSVAKREIHPVIVAEQWLKHAESPLLFWMTSWVVDLIRCSYASSANNLYNFDLQVTLQDLSTRTNVFKLYQLYDLLLISRVRLDTQVNKQALFEEILLQWLKLNRS